MMPTTIADCPLCGAPGQIKDTQGARVRQGWVGCPACGLYISWKISPDGAVRKWNRRCVVDGLRTTIELLKHQIAAMETVGGASPSPTGETEAGV